MIKMKRIVAVLLSMMMLCTMVCDFSVNAEPNSGAETENNETIKDSPEKTIEADEGEITIEVENEETESAPAEQAGQTPDVSEDIDAIEEDENVKEITPLDPEPSGEQNAEMAMVIQRAEDKGISLREAVKEIEAEEKEAERQAYAEKYHLTDIPSLTASSSTELNSNALMGPVQQQTAQVNSDSLLSRVACGYSHYIFLQDDGTVMTWGLYYDKALNIGQYGGPEHPTPRLVPGLSDIISVDSTEEFGYALKADGTVWIWSGNLIIEQTSSMLSVEQVEQMEDVISISAEKDHMLALTSEGTVWEWTEDESVEGTEKLTLVKNENGNTLSGIAAISAGTDHNLALSQDGTIYAWGDNFYGQLGDGTRESRDYAAPIQNNTEATNIVKISAEDGYSILEDADGGRWAWGKSDDIDGQTFDAHLWTVTNLDAAVASVQAVDDTYPPVGVKEISRYGKFGLALCIDGTVWQKGRYTYHYEDEDPNHYPEGMQYLVIQTYDTEWSQTQGLHSDVEIPEVPVYPVSASAFNNTQSMVVVDGYLMSAGDNNWGQLGDGTNTASKFPEFVIDYQDFEMDDVKKVSCGYGFDLILTEDGRVWSVGCADNGKLGVGETEHTNKVYPVRGKNGNGFLRDFVDISAGYKHGIAVKNDGSLWAWGHNSVGQLGDGTKVSSDVPVRVKGANGEDWLKNVVSAYANASTSMALESDGTVYMWGNNDKGQLGDGTKTNRQTPVQVKGENGQGYLTNIRQIATAEGCSIALDNTGKVWTWGGNQNGRLGDGTTNDRYYPGKVLKQDGTELSNIVSISVGYYFCAAVDEEGKVWTWGKNDHGQLGTSYQQGDRYFADTVSSTEGGGTLYGVTSVSCGRDYALAVQGQENIVLAWGSNQYGQFGIGTSGEETYTPVVAFDSDVYRDMTWLKAQMKNRQTVIPAQDSIILPKEGPNGSSISWTSSNNYYLDTNGNVRHPDQYGSDIEVTLTGVVHKDGVQDSETFTVKILQNTQLEPSTEVPIRTLGFEYDQRYPDTDSAIEAPQINSVTVKVIDEEEGVYRFYIRDDQYSVDPSSEKHFFFWTSREGTFLPVEGCTDYSQAQFTVDEELRNKKVKIIVGLGDGLGYIDRKAIILQGETTEVQQESVSLAENAVVQAMEQSLPEAAVAGEYAVNLAVGIDTSMEMLEFDPGNTKTWQMSIEGLIESAPENSAFHVVTSRTEETEHFSKTEAINALSSVLEDGYSGNQDEIELLEKTAQMLYNGNAGNKAAVIFVKGIEKPEEFEAKVEELEASGIAVYTMVLGGGYTGSKANIYNCESELDLRLNIAALYGAFSDMSTAQNGGILRANAAAAVSENYTSDFREEKHKVPTDTTATQFGKSIISVLNIYGCIPISAQKYSGTTTYSLFSADDESDENINMHSAQSVYNLLTGNAAGLYANTAIPMYNFFDEMESEFDWKNENIDALIEKNLKYRFPVVAKMGSGDNTKYTIITGQNANGYTYSSYGTVNNFTPEKVIDTYQYLLDVAKDAKNITDMVSKENSFYNEVRFQLPTDGAVKARSFTENAQGNIAGYANGIAISYQTQLEEDKEIKYGYFSTASYADNTKIVMGVEANYTGSMPDVYNMNKLYNVIKYSDLQATQLDAWYYPYLFEATNRGITNGEPTESGYMFAPDRELTRAEVLAMLLRSVDADVSGYDTLPTEKAEALYDEIMEVNLPQENLTALGLPGYTTNKDEYVNYLKNYITDADVSWASAYMNYAYEKGLIGEQQYLGLDYFANGWAAEDTAAGNPSQVGQNTGGANIKVRRDDAAIMLCAMYIRNTTSVNVPIRVYKYDKETSCEKNTYWNTDIAFSDIDRSYPFGIEEIYQMYMNGIMEGDLEKKFNPDHILTRAEACKAIVRSLFELDEDIEKAKLAFEDEPNYIDFATSNTFTITRQWDASGSGEFFFVVPRTGFYQISEVSGCTVKMYDQNGNELIGVSNFAQTGIRYSLEKGMEAYIRVSDAAAIYSFKIEIAQDNELIFTPKSGGKYIYSNNREAITKEDLADANNPNGPKLLFHQKNLTTGTYTLMIEHRNTIPDINIYLDVQFYDPNKNSTVSITKYGDDLFGTGHAGGDGTGKSWACMGGYAGFFGSSIGRVRTQTPDVDGTDNMIIPSNGLSQKISYPYHQFADADNNAVWLSEMYNHNYYTIEKYPVLTNEEGMYIMMEFEVVSEEGIDFSIAAFEASGNFEDRFNNYIATENAPYYNDNSLKGVAQFMPETEALLSFEVNDDTVPEGGEALQSIKISNPFAPQGRETTMWKTHMNPQFEEWNAHMNVESDILPLYYEDTYNNKSYIFDTRHSADDSNILLPTPTLDGNNGSSNHNIACNLGNYGVKTTYKVAIRNTGNETRIFCYRVSTKSNIFLSVRDAQNNPMDFVVNNTPVYAICTGQSKLKGGLHPITASESEVKVSLPVVDGEEADIIIENGQEVVVNSDSVTELQLEVPAGKETIYYIDEVLPTGDPGSISTEILFR